ncbi:unnamed protein product [Caenorhabditis bovis]|uniref:Uncharacterized protein n=1 Tax=Caenorhabditis bovis TaxID=2654633 RepID=A0A8S1EW00_9PELO|nr:unnamed protein product [Caenorhabditis bovis]
MNSDVRAVCVSSPLRDLLLLRRSQPGPARRPNFGELAHGVMHIFIGCWGYAREFECAGNKTPEHRRAQSSVYGDGRMTNHDRSRTPEHAGCRTPEFSSVKTPEYGGGSQTFYGSRTPEFQRARTPAYEEPSDNYGYGGPHTPEDRNEQLEYGGTQASSHYGTRTPNYGRSRTPGYEESQITPAGGRNDGYGRSREHGGTVTPEHGGQVSSEHGAVQCNEFGQSERYGANKTGKSSSGPSACSKTTVQEREREPMTLNGLANSSVFKLVQL